MPRLIEFKQWEFKVCKATVTDEQNPGRGGTGGKTQDGSKTRRSVLLTYGEMVLDHDRTIADVCVVTQVWDQESDGEHFGEQLERKHYLNEES